VYPALSTRVLKRLRRSEKAGKAGLLVFVAQRFGGQFAFLLTSFHALLGVLETCWQARVSSMPRWKVSATLPASVRGSIFNDLFQFREGS
jgi:hypothetical protein